MPTIPRFQVNGVVDTSASVLQNLNMIANSCGTWLSFDPGAGLWSVVMNKPSDSIKSYNDSNIIGSIAISRTGISEMYNAVSITFPHKDLRDRTDILEFEVPQVDRFPNELDNVLNIDLPITNDPVQAAFLGTTELKQSRLDQVIEFTTDYTSLGLKGGDVIDVTSDIYGFVNKKFRVVKTLEQDSDTGELLIAITALEYDDSIYSEDGLEKIERNKKTGIVPKDLNQAITEEEWLAQVRKLKLVPLVYSFVPAPNQFLDWINKETDGEAAWQGSFIINQTTRTQLRSRLPPSLGGTWSTVADFDNPRNWYFLGRQFTAPLTGWYKLKYFLNWGSEAVAFIRPDGGLVPVESLPDQSGPTPWITTPSYVWRASMAMVEINNFMLIPTTGETLPNGTVPIGGFAATGDARVQIQEDHQVELFFYANKNDQLRFWVGALTDWGPSHPENNLGMRAIVGLTGELYYVDAVISDVVPANVI
jgi:hypothetical protein